MSEREEIREVDTTSDSERPDRSIKCVDCNEYFVWTSGEQAFFHDKGLKNEPKRCKPCKQAKNERLAAITAAQTSGIRQRVEVSVQCAQCGQQTTVPFYPSFFKVALLKRIVRPAPDSAASHTHPRAINPTDVSLR